MAADFGDKEFDYGVGYPTPLSIPDDTSCWTIPVPNDAAWQAVLIGLLQTLTEEKSWQQYEGALSQEDAAGRWAEMVTEFLFNSLVGCSATPPDGIRYNLDTDAVQIQTPDGEWHDNPDADPRHSNSNKFPPLDSDNPRCDAAANMVAWVKMFIDTLVTVKDETGIIVAFFLDVLEVLWGAGIFLALITLFVETLLFLGLDAVLDAFTSGVYDQLLCIFYCNIESDGSVTADDLAVINTTISTEIGGNVATVLSSIFFIMGEVGLSNAGSTGTETGDCSGCDCEWCYEFDFTVSDGGWNSFSSPGANYTPGVGWTDATVGGTRGTYIESDTFAPTVFTHMELTYTALVNATSDVRYGRLSGTIVMIDVCSASLGTDIVVGWDGSETFDQVGLQVGNSTSFAVGSSVISKAKFRGTGTNPFGSDNC